MSGRYELYTSSWSDYGVDQEPLATSDYVDDLTDEAFYWFDQEGWYALIKDTATDEVVFRDYQFVGSFAGREM